MGVFEYKFGVPDDDGTDENLVITLRDWALIPSGIWWDYPDDGEQQLREKLKWGFVDDEARDNFRRLPEAQMPDMLRAWQEAGKIEEGESVASSASSTGTVRHSKPISSKTDSG